MCCTAACGLSGIFRHLSCVIGFCALESSQYSGQPEHVYIVYNTSYRPLRVKKLASLGWDYQPVWLHPLDHCTPFPLRVECVCVCVCVCECTCVHMCTHTQSCQTLCDSMDCSPAGSSVHGISQARILEWFAISFFRGSSWAKDGNCVPCVSCIGRQILYHCATWEAQE